MSHPCFLPITPSLTHAATPLLSCNHQALPELGVPELPSFLKPPKDFRSATFDVTYLDQGMRITRGDRWASIEYYL